MEAGVTTRGLLTARVALSRGRSICFAVVENGKTMFSNEVAGEPFFNERIDGLTDIHVKSLIVLPVKMKEYVVGLLKIINKRGDGKFTKEDIEIVESIGYSISIATKIAWLHDNLIKSIDELARAETEIDVLKESAQRIK